LANFAQEVFLFPNTRDKTLEEIKRSIAKPPRKPSQSEDQASSDKRRQGATSIERPCPERQEADQRTE
jgi:hypothetical protein